MDFKTEEFACSCCNASKVNQALIDALQLLRDKIKLPIIINSGYRCEAHNKAIGGEPHSQHVLGNAADIAVPRLPLHELFEAVESVQAFKKGGIGYYPQNGFVHADVRENKARWGKVDGKMVGIETALAYKGRI